MILTVRGSNEIIEPLSHRGIVPAIRRRLVEQRLMTEESFRDFMLVTWVALRTGVNPDFFRGTVIEEDVEKLRAEGIA
jgi:hypothetical protein